MLQFQRGALSIPFSRPLIVLAAMAFFIQLTGCRKDLVPDEQKTSSSMELQTSAKKKADHTVSPGQSIQAVVDAAAPNSVIRILAGTYLQTVIVDKPGIEIVGDDGVIIENPGAENNGITVRSNGDGFILRNVTVKNFRRNGVFMIRADNFLLSHVTAIDNGAVDIYGEYGLYPIFCNNRKIEHCEASGYNDSGIYIGQSTDIELVDNIAHDNVNGIEIENCTRVTAIRNQTYNNTAGFLIVLLPGLTTKTGNDILLAHNVINNNNHVNFARPGQFEAAVPQGTGVLIVGSDGTVVEHNKINNNQFIGVGVVSTLLLGQLIGLPPEAFADIEPNPDGTSITKNHLSNNGTQAPPGLPLPAVDLLWDGSGTSNCWSKNHYATSFPATLPSCN